MFGYTMRVPAPVGAYHALHRAIGQVVGDDPVDGLVLHLAHVTPDGGFAVTEVWESQDQLDAFNHAVLPRAMALVGMTEVPEADVVELDPCAVLVPGAYAWDRSLGRPTGQPTAPGETHPVA